MLVVVHDGYIEFTFESLFNLETLGCLYIFQVDAAKSGGNGFYYLDEFFRILLIHLDVEYINAGEDLE